MSETAKQIVADLLEEQGKIITQLQQDLTAARAEVERLKGDVGHLILLWNREQGTGGNSPITTGQMYLEKCHQLTAANSALEKARKALQRVWEEDECGWIITDGLPGVDCCKCNSYNLEGDKSQIEHEDYCTQGFIYEALSTINTILGKEKE